MMTLRALAWVAAVHLAGLLAAPEALPATGWGGLVGVFAWLVAGAMVGPRGPQLWPPVFGMAAVGLVVFLTGSGDDATLMAATISLTLALPAGALWAGSAIARGLGSGGRAHIGLGIVAWSVLVTSGAAAAERLFFDPEWVALFTIVWALLSAAVVGAGGAVTLRRFAFAEAMGVVFGCSFAAFGWVLFASSSLASSVNAPIEQVMVAGALFPPILLGAFATMGTSVGFLMFGYGRFDPGMRYELGVAIRYLRASRRQRSVGVVALISILCVAIGVMALIVILSVMSGFEGDLKDKILGAHAHIVVNKHGDDFREFRAVEDAVATVDGVSSSGAFVLADAMISTDVGLSGTLVKGIDATRPDSTRELAANMRSGRVELLVRPESILGSCKGAEESEQPCRPLPGIIIGRELSRTLRAYVGDVVKLVSPLSDELGPMGPVPKLSRFRVAGIFYSGMYEYDAKFSYLDMDAAQRFFGLEGRVTGVEVKLLELDDTSRIVTAMSDRLGGEPYAIRDWRDMNKELFSALLLEKIAMFIALSMIVVVASFLIIATLVLIVLQRGKEIAILKSLGSSDASIMKVFVLQGLIVGLLGAGSGVVGGLTICWYLENFGLPLDERVFYIRQLPVVLDLGEVVVVAMAAIMLTFLASVYPAWTASKLTPVEGLRDD